MAAPYQHGNATVVLLDGYNVTADLNASEFSPSRKVHEYEMYGANAVGRQGGNWGGTLTLGGLRSATIWDILQTATYATRGQFGTTIGLPAEFANVFLSQDTQSLPGDDLQPVEAELAIDGRLRMGRWLHALGVESGIHTTASVDNTVATTTGLTFVLHATAVTSTPTMSGVLQHSTNNSTWATLLTLTNVTAIGAQWATVAAGVTVNRYLRLNITALSGGTVTYAAASARMI